MTAIDFNAIARGDYVTVRLKVSATPDQTACGKLYCTGNDGGFAYLDESDIVSHEAAVTAGEWVLWYGGFEKARVLAVTEGFAMVKCKSLVDAVDVGGLTKTTPPA